MNSAPHSLPGQQESRWSKRRRWGARAIFAVLDQGLISGSNFLLGIQLARSLHPAGYGAYALAFSIFSLLLVLDQAIVLEPMSVFGGSKYSGLLRRYLGELLKFQSILSGVCLSLLLVAALGIGISRQSSDLYVALLGIGIATPSILLLYFTRRALYLEYRSSAAAGGAVLYCVLLFSGLWLVDHLGLISAFSAFLCMGAAALATSSLLMIYIRPRLKSKGRESEFQIVNEHWNYGRWALGSSAFMWISWNVWYTIVGSLSGLAGTGTLKAWMNLAMPVIQSCAALSLLVLPHTSRVVHVEGWAGAKRQALTVASLFTAGATVYWVVVLTCHKPIIAFLYSGRYADGMASLQWLALASIASAASIGPVSALRALEKPSTVCAAYFVSSVAGLGAGIPATRIYGVSGAIAGVLIASLLALALAVYMLVRAAPRQARSCALAMSETVLQ